MHIISEIDNGKIEDTADYESWCAQRGTDFLTSSQAQATWWEGRPWKRVRQPGPLLEGHLAVGRVELKAHIWSLGVSLQSCNPGR